MKMANTTTAKSSYEVIDRHRCFVAYQPLKIHSSKTLLVIQSGSAIWSKGARQDLLMNQMQVNQDHCKLQLISLAIKELICVLLTLMGFVETSAIRQLFMVSFPPMES
ncbi:hypothetical protein ACQ4PT_029554 [Festuca glaucescens]